MGKSTLPAWKVIAFVAVVGAVATVALSLDRRVRRPEQVHRPELSQLWLLEEREKEAAVAGEKIHKAPAPEPFMPLLFCFAMLRATGYEVELMSAQYYNGAGIFACDEYKLYSTGGVASIGPLKSIEVDAPTSSMGDLTDGETTTSSWLNTLTFFKVWEMLTEDGAWWNNDWTVKVDPDAVFFPHRLRIQIKPHTFGLNAEPRWVGNCDRIWGNEKPHLKLFGSVEIFSRNAVGTYKAFMHKCRAELPWHGWGEDLFMQSCMEKLQVQAINGTGFLGDKRCHDAPCTDTTKVAFHDFKSIEPFFQCWGQSKGSEHVEKQLEKERREEEKRLARLAREAEKLAKKKQEESQVVPPATTIAPIVQNGAFQKPIVQTPQPVQAPEVQPFSEVYIRK